MRQNQQEPAFLDVTQLGIYRTIMDNIQNTRGKGYCILYILMGLFFFVGLILMLYMRSGVLEFPK